MLQIFSNLVFDMIMHDTLENERKGVAFILRIDCFIRELISHCFNFLLQLTQDKSFREKCLRQSCWIHAK